MNAPIFEVSSNNADIQSLISLDFRSFLGSLCHRGLRYNTLPVGSNSSNIRGCQICCSYTSAGKLIDRYGAKKILVGLLTLTPILSIAFLYSNSFVHTLTVLSCIEVFNVFTIPAFQSMMTGLIPKEMRGRVLSALGLGNFYVDTRGVAIGHGALLFAPGMLAFILGGVLYGLNATYPFIFMTMGSIVNAIIALKLLPSKK